MKDSTKKFLKGMIEQDFPDEAINAMAKAFEEIDEQNLHPYSTDYHMKMIAATFEAGVAVGRMKERKEFKKGDL